MRPASDNPGIMTVTAELPVERFNMLCIRCDRTMLGRPEWSGREVQCPYCSSVLIVPDPPLPGHVARAIAPGLSPREIFYFGCARCGTLLEGHTGMCGHAGHCPACAARLEIPYVDDRGQPLAATILEGDVELPAPVHAYAASGEQAPRLIRAETGETIIECPRCRVLNSIEADACVNCGAPFTSEGTVTTDRIARDSLSTAALAAGIISIPLMAVFVPGVIAVACWLGAVWKAEGRATPVVGRVGAALGALSILGGGAVWLIKW